MKETKPHYLELLNTLALAEKRAGIFLKAWVDTTPDDDFRASLALVAARETSHYHMIKRRIEELGYVLVENDDPEFEETLKVGGSDMPDIEKIQRQRARQQRPEIQSLIQELRSALSDESVDSLTRSLLRWFIEEEEDSGKVMTGAYARIEAT